MFFCSELKSAGVLGLVLLLAGTYCLADGVPPPPEPYQPMPTDAPPPKPAQVPAAADADVPLEILLKNNLGHNLPRELVFQENRDWGHQAHVPSIQGVRLIEVLRNHGNWEKMSVVCHNAPQNLALVVHEVRLAAAGGLSLAIHVSLPGVAEIEKRVYQNGLQVLAEHGRVRFRIETHFLVETGLKMEWKGQVPPDNALDFKIVNTKVFVHDFMAENVNGVGGEVARMTGGNLHGLFKDMQPNLERDMRNQLNEAMFKTGVTPQVGISFAQLIRLATTQAALAPSVPFQTLPPREVSLLLVPTIEVVPGPVEPIGAGSLVIDLNFWTRIRSPEQMAKIHECFIRGHPFTPGHPLTPSHQLTPGHPSALTTRFLPGLPAIPTIRAIRTTVPPPHLRIPITRNKNPLRSLHNLRESQGTFLFFLVSQPFPLRMP